MSLDQENRNLAAELDAGALPEQRDHVVDQALDLDDGEDQQRLLQVGHLDRLQNPQDVLGRVHVHHERIVADGNFGLRRVRYELEAKRRVRVAAKQS